MSEKRANEQIIEGFERLKTILLSTEDDVRKNALGNASAGLRARKALRILKKETHDLVRLTVEQAKKDKSA